MSNLLTKLPKPNIFLAIGASSLLVVAFTAAHVESEIESAQHVETGPVKLVEDLGDSYARSVASGFIAEHIGISSGSDPAEFSEYSAKLAQTLTRLTPEQRDEVFSDVASYEKDIFASE